MGATTQVTQFGTTKNAADDLSNRAAKDNSPRRFLVVKPITTLAVVLSLVFLFGAPVCAQRLHIPEPIHEPIHTGNAAHAPAAKGPPTKEGEKVDQPAD